MVEGIQAFTSGEIAEVIEPEPATSPLADPADPAPPAPPAPPGAAPAEGAGGTAPAAVAAAPPQLLIQWDTIGQSSTIGAADVNVSFTALHMRDRLMSALKLIQDLSHSEYELPDEDLSATLTAVLAGKCVDPELQDSIDGAKITYEDVEIVLSQADVKGTLLPVVKEEWSRFYGAIVAQELGTAELHRRFHTMEKEAQRETEIRLLAATGHGCVDEAGAKDEWVPLVLSKISAFILCEGCQSWIPGIVRVREMCADLFDTTAEDDESLKRLQGFVQTMSEAWTTEHLSTVSTQLLIYQSLACFTDPLTIVLLLRRSMRSSSRSVMPARGRRRRGLTSLQRYPRPTCWSAGSWSTPTQTRSTPCCRSAVLALRTRCCSRPSRRSCTSGLSCWICST